MANNGYRIYENEADEDSKGLSLLEYMRLKRLELRKDLRNTIWNSTPSPPRIENDTCEFEDEDVAGISDKNKEVMSENSEPDDSRSTRRNSRKSRTLKRTSRRKLNESDQYDDSSDDYSGSDSKEEYRRQKARRKSRRHGRKGRVSRKRWRDISSDERSEDSDVSGYSEDKSRRKKIVLLKNKKETERDRGIESLDKVDYKVGLKLGDVNTKYVSFNNA